MKWSGFKNKPRKPLKRTAFSFKSTIGGKNGTKPIKTRATGILEGNKRKIGRPKPKKDRIKTLKRKVWSAFSLYIRKKHADHAGYVITCDSGETKHYTEVHCGHLFHNSERSSNLGGNELWYYENNFAPQSVAGNYFNKDDASKKYTLYAVRKYGLEEVEKMSRMRHVAKKWTEEELIALLDRLSTGGV